MCSVQYILYSHLLVLLAACARPDARFVDPPNSAVKPNPSGISRATLVLVASTVFRVLGVGGVPSANLTIGGSNVGEDSDPRLHILRWLSSMAPVGTGLPRSRPRRPRSTVSPEFSGVARTPLPLALMLALALALKLSWLKPQQSTASLDAKELSRCRCCTDFSRRRSCCCMWWARCLPCCCCCCCYCLSSRP